MKQCLRGCVWLTVALAGVLGLSVAQAQEAEKKDEGAKKWESSAGAGLTLTRGNSDTLTATVNAQTARKWVKDEFLAGANITYGESDNEKTAESYQAYAQYNHLFTERLYGGLRFDFLKDDIADLDYRFTVSPLLGYYFVKNPNTFLSGEVGPSLIYEKQGGEEDFYVGARVGERFEHKFSAKARIWQSLEFIPQVDEFDNWLLIAEVGAEAALTGKLALRVVLQDIYDNMPAPDREKNDMKLIAGLNYKF